MEIVIEDRPHSLLELLWIREAYELNPHGDGLPPLLSDTPVAVQDGLVSASIQAEWDSAWPRIWTAAIRTDIKSPGWREEFGDSAFDNESFRSWSRRGWDTYLKQLPARAEDGPEWRDLDNLIPAWRVGLRKIIVIPCRGVYTRKVSEHTLLINWSTRNTSDSYRPALNTFA